MTSDDTHTRTLDLLESNSYFGMKPTQVKLLKQQKVACLDDNDARFALDPHNKYKIQTKPHGHGDVHALLYSSGFLNVCYIYIILLSSFSATHDAGLRWVLFFQDTNGLQFKAIPASLGVGAIKQYHVNSLAVQRKAKEAIGGITRLTHSDGRSMVINVEYNQLDPLLRATGHSDGDVNCETGYSPFPGNINQFLGKKKMSLDHVIRFILRYCRYKDASKTSFKSSTRLECMMQDYPKTLPPTARVGFSVIGAYAPVKNNPEDAAKYSMSMDSKSRISGLGSSIHNGVTESISEREQLCLKINFLLFLLHHMRYLKGIHITVQLLEKWPYIMRTVSSLKRLESQVKDPVQQVFNGQEVEVWPRVTWKPKWGMTFAEIKSKVNGSCSISQRSTMALKGRNIFLEDLSLDGALIINSIDGAEVKVGGLIQNKGWLLESIDFKDSGNPEEVRIRGFKINKLEQLEETYNEPGNFTLKP
ncbi:hypothetical protein REPUB_Repub19eG0106800 [Reevesia pubescens]